MTWRKGLNDRKRGDGQGRGLHYICRYMHLSNQTLSLQVSPGVTTATGSIGETQLCGAELWSSFVIFKQVFLNKHPKNYFSNINPGLIFWPF